MTTGSSPSGHLAWPGSAVQEGSSTRRPTCSTACAELSGEPEIKFQIACGLAHCAADARARGDRPALERDDAWRRYADRALAALRAANRAGFHDRKRLGEEPALKSLRPLRDFQLLMMDLAMPDDTFAP